MCALLQVMQNYWLTIWSHATQDVEVWNAGPVDAPADAAPREVQKVDVAFYMGIYFAFGCTSLFMQVRGRAAHHCVVPVFLD